MKPSSRRTKRAWWRSANLWSDTGRLEVRNRKGTKSKTPDCSPERLQSAPKHLRCKLSKHPQRLTKVYPLCTILKHLHAEKPFSEHLADYWWGAKRGGRDSYIGAKGIEKQNGHFFKDKQGEDIAACALGALEASLMLSRAGLKRTCPWRPCRSNTLNKGFAIHAYL